MFKLIRSLTMQSALIEQLPALLISIAIAEFFYKFHSFLLECIAFLVTWYVVDALMYLGRVLLGIEKKIENATPTN